MKRETEAAIDKPPMQKMNAKASFSGRRRRSVEMMRSGSPMTTKNRQGQQANYKYVLAHSLNKSVKILSHETTELTASEARAALLATMSNRDDLELPLVNMSIPTTAAQTHQFSEIGVIQKR